MKPWLFEDLTQFLDEITIQTIGEIGTHKGNTSIQLIKYLSKKEKNIVFHGYDIFDYAKGNVEFNRKEMNGKGGASFEFVKNRLDKLKESITNFDFILYKGLTQDTLKNQTFDFVYIDGGHSYETVKHDYSMVKESKLIVFDDAVNKINASQVAMFLKELESDKEIEYYKRWAIIRNYA